MRGRQVIDATQLEGAITSARGGLEIRGLSVPLEDVSVLLLGSRATISGGALTMLSKYDVIVLNCDWRGVPDLVGYSWIDNSRVATRHRRQAELSAPRRKNAWQQIVKAKLRGQARNLAAIGHPATARVERLRDEVRSGDPANCEAQAAKVYWEAYLGAEFDFQRVPGANDRINALLNYGYTVMRGFVIQGIATAGLWPTYGIWHRNRSNTFALADDLIEPFRPAVDYRVRSFGTDDTLEEPQVKRNLVAVLSEPLNGEDGSSVATCIYDFAAQLANYVEGDKERLEPPSWTPPKTPALPALTRSFDNG